MTKKKLLDDITHNPPRYYRAPGDVLRDRRFGDAERICILQAWLSADGTRTAEISPLIVELEGRVLDHAAE